MSRSNRLLNALTFVLLGASYTLLYSENTNQKQLTQKRMPITDEHHKAIQESVDAANENRQEPLTDVQKAGMKALLTAQLTENTNAIITAIDKGAAIYMTGMNDTEATLLWAAASGYTEAVALLLDRKANVNVIHPTKGFTPLLMAVSGGHIDTVKLLIDRGAQVHTLVPHTITALKIATLIGHADIARLLVKAGADTSFLADPKYQTNETIRHVIEEAQKERDQNIDNYLANLLQQHDDPQVKMLLLSTVLIPAVARGDIKTTQKILNLGFSPNSICAVDMHGCTPLMLAAINNYIDIAKLLLKKGANVNAGEQGMTALLWASGTDNIDMIKLLIDHKADVNIKVPRLNMTPLLIAALSEKIEVVRLLVAAGADTSFLNDKKIVIKPSVRSAITAVQQEKDGLLGKLRARISTLFN